MTQPSGFPRRVATLVMDPDDEEPAPRRSSGSILVFRIGSDLALVDEAGKRLHEVCLRAPFTEADACDVELCAREALSNVIEHAYGGEAGHTIDIVALCSSSSIVVEIADEGRPASPELIEVDPGALTEDVLASIDDLAERGRGISILHALMDTIRYRTAGGRNVLTLTRKADSPKRT